MARRGKSYSQRSASSRRKIDDALKAYGLDRGKGLRALREGKWRPFARDITKRVPPGVNMGTLRENAKNAMMGMGETTDSEGRVWQNVEFNEQAITDHIGRLSPEQLAQIRNLTPDEIREKARKDANRLKGINKARAARGLAPIISPFWYHFAD